MRIASILFAAVISMSCHAKQPQSDDCPLPSKAPPATSLKVDFLGVSSKVDFQVVGDDDDQSVRIFLSRDRARRIYVDEILPEGGAPIIESVFTDQADKDPAKELFVLVKWEVGHAGLETEGSLFQVRIYDNAANSDDCGMARIDALEKRFGMGLEGLQEGEAVRYKYKNAAEIRKHLRELGYRR